MLPIDNKTLDALTGSRVGDRLEVFAWYGGKLSYPEALPISDWSITWDGSASKQVQGVLSLTVDDPDGSLAPWLWDDPLGVGGAELVCRYVVGGAGTVNRGRYRITGNDPKESWYSRTIRDDSASDPGGVVPPGNRLVMVSGGTLVPLTAEDMTVNLVLDEFLAPEQPAGTSPTVMSEIRRIVGDHMPVVFTGVSDVKVDPGATYDGPRVDAVMDLAARAGASLRMGGSGELEVYKKSQNPVWAVAGGDDGALININRSQSVDLLDNIGVARGEAKYKDGAGQEQVRPLTGIARVTEGPLRVGGPHGVKPRFMDSKLLNTQEEVDAAAGSLITNHLAGLTLDLEVTCLPNPALQVGDWVTVTQPVVDGRLVPLVGEVVTMKLQGSATAVGNMVLKVRCSFGQVQNVRGRAFRY